MGGFPTKIRLDNEHVLLMDPDTLFWMLAEPTRVDACKRRFAELYSNYCDFTRGLIRYVFEKISEHGIDVIYRLVGADFAQQLQNGRRLVWVEE